MPNLSTEQIMLLTAGIIGIELIFFAALFLRKGQFIWTSYIFWAWASFGLYFVINPLFSVITGNIDGYHIRLQISGGVSRGIWILIVLFIGIMVYFCSYSFYSPKLKNDIAISNFYSAPIIYLLIIWIAIGGYFLLKYRTFNGVTNVQIESGRFIGSTSAYQSSGYLFLFVPIALLLFSQVRSHWVIGTILAISFAFLTLPTGNARFAPVSMIILLTLIAIYRFGRKWPPVSSLVILLLFVGILQIQGHRQTHISKVGTNLYDNLIEAIFKFENVLAAQDSAMLATFYLESYLHDTVVDYQYGIVIANYALVGVIPSQLFPEKYFLVDRLNQYRYIYSDGTIDNLLYGAKSTLLGDLYANAGITCVIIGMFILGIISKTLDLFLFRRINHPLYQVVAFTFMSQLWMIWGSPIAWALMRLGFICIPIITFLQVFKLTQSKRKQSHQKLRTQSQLVPHVFEN